MALMIGVRLTPHLGFHALQGAFPRLSNKYEVMKTSTVKMENGMSDSPKVHH
jgi:hypothetical protein